MDDFYDNFEKMIQNELNNMKSDEKSGNEESSAKIKSVMQILEYLSFEKPKIKTENGEIKLIDEAKK